MKREHKLVARGSSKLILPGRERPYILAHRGVMAHEPENTVRSFLRALAEGADLLETDIHFCADHVPVCIHDATVDRTTDGAGRVNAFALPELKQLRTLGLDGEPTDQQILTLDEFLELIPLDRGVALEIKDDRVAYPHLAGRIAAALQEHQLTDRAVVLSFKWAHLRAVQRVAPWLPVGLITLNNLWPGQPCQLLGPLPLILRLNPWYVRLAHRQGKLVCPLDPRPEKRVRWYLRMGVDALLTNDTAATVQALASTRSPAG